MRGSFQANSAVPELDQQVWFLRLDAPKGMAARVLGVVLEGRVVRLTRKKRRAIIQTSGGHCHSAPLSQVFDHRPRREPISDSPGAEHVWA